jgi:hypothetical protein
VANSTEQQGLQHGDIAENKARFLAIATLYGWIGSSDDQFIYDNTDPRLVHTVDHGHFFPGGPDWTADSLATASPDAVLHQPVLDYCPPTKEEVAVVEAVLTSITDDEIAAAVSSVPADWVVSAEERSAVTNYLIARRDTLAASMRKFGNGA